MGKISSLEPRAESFSSEQAQAAFVAATDQLLRWVREDCGASLLHAFEAALWARMMELGRLALVLFLALREERSAAERPAREQRGDRVFRGAPPHARQLNTRFGWVRYVRGYMREVRRDGAARRGYYPLDLELGLTSDRLTMGLLACAVRLATKLSFAEARELLGGFHPAPPSTEVIEQAVLGLGRHTAAWFEQAPAPSRDGEDGDVLVIMVDGKGAPTATEQELSRRRRKRGKRKALSPRHRGRQARRRRGSKPRRTKGDKSKNARMASMLVMYTLRTQGKGAGLRRLGPLNVFRYASFAPKRHAFEIARREAAKRGFHESSGKLVQVVTDGDLDLARLTAEYFPQARHTVDIWHVVEKLWIAGECLHKEGSKPLKDWMQVKKQQLYEGQLDTLLDQLEAHLDEIPKTGPGNKGRRQRLNDVIDYLNLRTAQMDYARLIREDLELGSGMVEGAVKNVIAKRCDHGGMRWIRERAEAVLQLRCIELNGDWEAFVAYVHDVTRQRGLELGERVRLQHAQPGPLPTIQAA